MSDPLWLQAHQELVMQMWAECVADCLDEQNAGGAYLRECNAYKAALNRDAR